MSKNNEIVLGSPISLTDPFGLSPHKLKSKVHAALDVIGFIPGIGDFADLVNAGIYILEGDVKNAIMSGVCALPLVGEMAGGAKIMSKVPKAARYVECTTKVIGHSANFICAAEAGGTSAVNIYHNAKDGNLLSWDTLKNAGVFGLSAVSMVFCGKQVAGSGKELAGMLKQDAPRAISKVKESVSSVGKAIKNEVIEFHHDNRGFIDFNAPIEIGKGGSNEVSWSNHGHKHFPNKSQTWKEVVKSTKSGPAKYSFDIQDVETFERAAWDSGIPVTNGKHWRVNKYETIIGAVNGKETVYVRIENSSNTIHGHPISETEYNKLLKEH